MVEEPELSLDELLAVLGNPLRREILARLAMETHYPLQLARELNVSQQAIMKQLTILREHRLVRCSETRSTKYGPPRKCYVGTGRFSIRIDFGPSTFETRLAPIEPAKESIEVSVLEHDFEDAVSRKDSQERLRALMTLVSRINTEMEQLEDRRSQLAGAKQTLLQEASRAISGLSGDYEERILLHALADRPGSPLEELAREFDIHREVFERFTRLMDGDDFFPDLHPAIDREPGRRRRTGKRLY